MKNLLLGLAILFPLQAISSDDSVYSWGIWSQGVKPAAGPVRTVTPKVAQSPNVKFRPNENSAFYRSSNAATPAIPNGPGTPATPAIPAASGPIAIPNPPVGEVRNRPRV